jgi:hypothetical protein
LAEATKSGPQSEYNDRNASAATVGGVQPSAPLGVPGEKEIQQRLQRLDVLACDRLQFGLPKIDCIYHDLRHDLLSPDLLIFPAVDGPSNLRTVEPSGCGASLDIKASSHRLDRWLPPLPISSTCP